MRRHPARLVVAALVLVSLGARRRLAQAPRHTTTLSLKALVSALHGFQDGEQALYHADTLPALTMERHRGFNAKMVQIWTAADDAVSVVEAWRPGQSIPPQLAGLLTQVRALLRDMATILGTVLPEQVTKVWDAIIELLLMVNGGAP
jgi:hypothetical protein